MNANYVSVIIYCSNYHPMYLLQQKITLLSPKSYEARNLQQHGILRTVGVFFVFKPGTHDIKAPKVWRRAVESKRSWFWHGITLVKWVAWSDLGQWVDFTWFWAVVFWVFNCGAWETEEHETKQKNKVPCHFWNIVEIVHYDLLCSMFVTYWLFRPECISQRCKQFLFGSCTVGWVFRNVNVPSKLWESQTNQ